MIWFTAQILPTKTIWLTAQILPTKTIWLTAQIPPILTWILGSSNQQRWFDFRLKSYQQTNLNKARIRLTKSILLGLRKTSILGLQQMNWCLKTLKNESKRYRMYLAFAVACLNLLFNSESLYKLQKEYERCMISSKVHAGAFCYLRSLTQEHFWDFLSSTLAAENVSRLK